MKTKVRKGEWEEGLFGKGGGEGVGGGGRGRMVPLRYYKLEVS